MRFGTRVWSLGKLFVLAAALGHFLRETLLICRRENLHFVL